jgi:serine/threonine-protein kinase
MSPGWRISPGLLATIAAAALSFGVCFAVVADATRTSSPGRAPAPRAERAAKTTLALQPAASLRVRSDLLPPPAPPPREPVKAASTEPKPTTTEPTQQEAPRTTTTTPAEPVTTPQPQASKPKPKKKREPKPSGPDFDDSGPQTPPSGG